MRTPTRLSLLSVIIPARDEQECIATTLEKIAQTLSLNQVPHEILVVDDGSTDQTWKILTALEMRLPRLRVMRNPGPHGFGRAVSYGLDHMAGDAVVIMMADESEDCDDAIHYWQKLHEGFDCVFGSRFIEGGKVIDYPWPKYVLNRLGNHVIKLLFGLPFNDTTNPFKAYRKRAIDGCRPLQSTHFDLAVELALKAIVRGYSWAVVPVTWKDRRAGVSKFKLHKMAMRYLLTVFSVWLETWRRPAAPPRSAQGL